MVAYKQCNYFRAFPELRGEIPAEPSSWKRASGPAGASPSHDGVAISLLEFLVALNDYVCECDRPSKALHRCLIKPGGVYLFVTPNAKSFVPWAAKTLHTLKMDEFVLQLLRGRQQVKEYHYPLQYRCNTPRQLDRCARESGFAPPEYAYLEGSGVYGYLRGPLKPMRQLLIWKRRLWRNPARLATLYCRMTKPR